MINRGDVEKGTRALEEFAEVNEARFGLRIAEIAEPVEGIGLLHNDEVLHGEEDVGAFGESGGTGPPSEGAPVNLAKMRSRETAVDLFAELGDVWLHAAGIVENDTKITAADLDAADVSFFDSARFRREVFLIFVRRLC